MDKSMTELWSGGGD